MRIERLRLNRVHGLLALVLLMAFASGIALWGTVRQAQWLAQPDQHGDLWHVANVNSELARVYITALQLDAPLTPGATETPDLAALSLRLDVLASVLDGTQRLPQLRQRLAARVPMAHEVLSELAQHVAQWNVALQDTPASEALPQVARTIRLQAPGLQERVRQAVAAVHVAASNDNASDREQLQRRFVVLSLVLGSLLVGATALVWQLARNIQLAEANSRQLTSANQRLEARVMARTRQIEEGRLLLNFILDASPSEVLLIHAQTDAVIFINQRLLARLDLPSAPSHLPLRELLKEPAQAQALQDALEKQGEVQGMEALLGSHPPAWASISARLIEVDGQLAYLLWSFDIGVHKRLEAHLRDLATTDPHSGLIHRHVYLDKGAALLEQCTRLKQNCAVMAIGIDDFSHLAATHGPPQRDHIVSSLAASLRDVLRESDALGRLSEATFGVVMPRADEQAALDAALRLRKAAALLASEPGSDSPAGVSVSIGFSTRRSREVHLDTLRQEAEQALLRAQQLGGGQIVVFPSPQPHHHATTDR